MFVVFVLNKQIKPFCTLICTYYHRIDGEYKVTSGVKIRNMTLCYSADYGFCQVQLKSLISVPLPHVGHVRQIHRDCVSYLFMVDNTLYNNN